MNTMTTANRFRAVIATTLFGVFASCVTVLPAAADDFDAPTATVHYSDLKVSSAQGAATLYARIRAAANTVCSTFDGPGINAKVQRNACVDKATLSAVTKINSSALANVYSAKTGKEVPTRLVSNSK